MRPAPILDGREEACRHLALQLFEQTVSALLEVDGPTESNPHCLVNAYLVHMDSSFRVRDSPGVEKNTSQAKSARGLFAVTSVAWARVKALSLNPSHQTHQVLDIFLSCGIFDAALVLVLRRTAYLSLSSGPVRSASCLRFRPCAR